MGMLPSVDTCKAIHCVGHKLVFLVRIAIVSLLYSAPIQHSPNDNEDQEREVNDVLKANVGQGKRSLFQPNQR
jgi:hypothetical protein